MTELDVITLRAYRFEQSEAVAALLHFNLGQRFSASFDELTGRLIRDEDSTVFESSRRLVSEMHPVLYNDSFREKPGSVAYYVLRELGSDADLGVFRGAGVRFDVTVLLPGDWGGELVKTFGHLHMRSPVSHPEIYEVERGVAQFLLQKSTGSRRVEVVRAEEGEKVMIPPDVLHLMINPSENLLVTSNLVAENVVQDYGFITRTRGAAYYELVDGRFVRNRNYDGDYELKTVDANSRESGNTPTEHSKRKLYDLFLDEPEVLDFLVGRAE